MKTKKQAPAVLITGGARRIGRSVALAFADDGWDVALHFNSSESEAQVTAGEIRGKGRKCVCFQAALDRPGKPQALVAGAAKVFPGLTALVHCASLFVPSQMNEEALPVLEAHLNIHVRVPWALGAAFVRLVKKGSIIHFLDTRISTNKTEFAAYLLSKKALAQYVGMSAMAYAPDVRVNAIAPGFILPPEGKGPRYLKSRAAVVPLKRKGNVGHVTEAVKFLVHNDYITGQIIYVDGGEHLI